MIGWSPLIFILQSGRFESAFGHEEERPHGMQVKHGRLHFSELDGSDANSPNVAEVIVASFTFHSGDLPNRKGMKNLMLHRERTKS